MRTVCAFLICSLAVALANRTPEGDALIDKHLRECRKELNIPDPAALARGEPQGAAPTGPPNFGCMLFCMQKKQGSMNEDGSVNKEALQNAKVTAAEKEQFQRLVEQCEKTVKPLDGCKMAACLAPDVPSR